MRSGIKINRIPDAFSQIGSIRDDIDRQRKAYALTLDSEHWNKLKRANWLVKDIVNNACKEGDISIVKEFLNFRGPDGMWSDPRCNDNICLKMAITKNQITIIRLLLNWRSPTGHFIDMSESFISKDILLDGDNTLSSIVLEWRGPSGEFVDLSRYKDVRDKIVHTRSAEHILKYSKSHMFNMGGGRTYHRVKRKTPIEREWVLRRLMEWRGPEGEYMDFSDVNVNDCIIYNNHRIFEMLAKWRGPKHEYVNIARIDISNCIKHNCHQIIYHGFKWKGPNKSEFVDVSDDGKALLGQAVRRNYVSVAKLLLCWKHPLTGKKLDATHTNNYLIRYAHKREYTDIVDLLLGWVGSNGEKIDPSVLPTTNDIFEEYEQVIGKMI